MKHAFAIALGGVMFAITQPPAAHAETPGTQEVTGEATRLVLLGTAGGPSMRRDRSQPASMIQVGDRTYLIDAGAGTVRQLAKAGVEVADLHKVFFTHLHMDHTAGFATLLGFRWLHSPAEPMLVIGPPGTAATVAGAARFLGAAETLSRAQLPGIQPMSASVTVEEIDSRGPTIIYRDDEITVTAVENSHFTTFDDAGPTQTKSYSYRFDTPDRSIVITGDTGPSAAVEALAKDADILLAEVVSIPEVTRLLEDDYNLTGKKLETQLAHMREEHLTPQELGKLAKRAKVKMLVVTHIVMGSNELRDLRAYSQAIREVYDGPVVMGQDLDEF